MPDAVYLVNLTEWPVQLFIPILPCLSDISYLTSVIVLPGRSPSLFHFARIYIISPTLKTLTGLPRLHLVKSLGQLFHV